MGIVGRAMILVINGVLGPLKMVENKGISLGLFCPYKWSYGPLPLTGGRTQLGTLEFEFLKRICFPSVFQGLLLAFWKIYGYPYDKCCPY